MPSQETKFTLRAEFDQALAALKRVQQELEKTGQNAKKTGDQFQAAQDKLEKWGPAAKRTFAGVAVGMTAATVAFASFEKQAVNVQNITELSDEAMAGLSDQILELPPALGEADDLMKGLYQTISAGITDPEKALNVLAANAKAARGGMADLTRTIDASTSVLAAFDIPAEDMITVLDKMTKTVDLGKLNFEDLAGSIGQGATIIGQAGVSFEELLSALATLTQRGLSTSEAMTAVRSMMVAVLKPIKEASEMAEDLGINFSTAAIKSMGFTAWLDELVEKTGGSNEILSQLFGRVEGLQGALTLVSASGGAKFVEYLDKIRDSAGKVEGNFGRMSETMADQVAAMLAELKKLGIDFGKLIAEDITPLIKGFRETLTTLRNMDPAWKEFVITLGKTAAGLSAVILVAPKLIKGWVAMKGALAAIGPAGTTAAAGVRGFTAALGPAVIAGVALNTAINALAAHIDKISDKALEASKKMQQESVAFQKAIVAHYGSIETAFEKTGRSAEGLQKWINAVKEGKEISTAEARNLIWLTEKFEEHAERTKEAAEANEELSGTQEDVAVTSEAATKKLKKYNRELAELIDYAQKIIDKHERMRIEAALGVGDELREQYNAWEDIDRAIDDAYLSLEDLLDLASDTLIAPEFDDSNFSRQVQQMAEIMRSEFAWAIADGLTNGFADFTPERFAEDWASMISELIGSQLQDVLSGKEGVGGGFRNMMEAIRQNPAMFGLGGAGMVYGAATGPQAGTTGGIVQGMIGGAVMGASAGGWVGAVVGAIVGGVMAAQGDEDPETRATLGFRAGRMFATSATRGGQGIGAEEHQLFQQKLIGAYSELKLAYRGLLGIFDDESLFDLVGALPEFDSQGWLGMSIDELGRYLTEAILPEGFENTFRTAIETGLGRLGVGAGALDALWAELGQLAGGQRIQALETFIGAIVGGAQLLEDLDFGAIMDVVGQTPREAFTNMMTEALGQVDLAMVGWDQLTLLEQAREAQNIQQLVEQARQAEIQYLQQIVQLGDQINRSIDMQVEQLRVGGMGRQQQAEFFTSQLDMIFETLAAGGLDPNQIAQLTGDAQRYINQLGGVFGEDLDALLATMFGIPGSGQQAFLDQFQDILAPGATGRDFLVGLLEHLRGLSGGAMDDAIGEAEDINAQFRERIEDIMARLFDFETAVDESGPVIREWGNEMVVFASRVFDASEALDGFTNQIRDFARIDFPERDTGGTEKSMGGQTVINIDPRLSPFVRLTRSIVRQEMSSAAYQGTS